MPWLPMAAVDPAAIDLIIVANVDAGFHFSEYRLPIQGKLGNKGACASTSRRSVPASPTPWRSPINSSPSGSHCKALVIGTEVFSRILDWQDRGTMRTFGDGAGALVLSVGCAGNSGQRSSCRRKPGRILNVPGQISGGRVCGDPFLRMDGQTVFKFAVRVLAEVAEEVCAQAGFPLQESTG